MPRSGTLLLVFNKDYIQTDVQRCKYGDLENVVASVPCTVT